MSDIGRLTHALEQDAQWLLAKWRESPKLRDAFGRREQEDLDRASDYLAELQQFITIHMYRKRKETV